MQNYTGYAGDFIMQSHVLVCCSWRNDGYIKVAVLIPTAKPMVSPSLFVKEINFKLPSTDYTNDEAKICYDTESLKVVTADRKSTRLNSSHLARSRMPSSA